MATGWPAIVIDPLRAGYPAFGVTENATVPLPRPGLPDCTTIQPASGAAIHGQPGWVDTVRVAAPPELPNDDVEAAAE